MFLDHDDIDSFGVLESQETKPSGSAGAAVSHHSALDDFAELGKVVSQRFCRLLASLKITLRDELGHTVSRLPVQSTNEHFSRLANVSNRISNIMGSL